MVIDRSVGHLGRLVTNAGKGLDCIPMPYMIKKKTMQPK